jgi:hypothetical protein
LADALAEAEQLLQERGDALAVLTKSHAEIPRLLTQRLDLQSELGAAEMAGQDSTSRRKRLSDIETALNTQRRMRSASIEQLVRQEDNLDIARAAVESAQGPFNSRIAADLQARYSQAVRTMQQLWAEADQTGAALGTEIDLPLPVRVVAPECGSYPWSFVDALEVKITRDEGAPAAVEIDPSVTRLASVRAGLAQGLNHCSGLRASKRLEQRSSPQTQRPFDANGVFEVCRPFINQVDGLAHAAGTLVDQSIVTLASLQRGIVAKNLRLVTAGAAGAAA